MEAVVFDGKEYIKASVLAEKFRYTQDYLGQLCRGKKVDARLVGRAWYINLDSLETHKTARYKTAEITPKKPSNNYASRIDVEPFLKNKTVKIFKVRHGALSEVPVRYEKDEYALIPRVNKEAVSVSIPILPAEAERLKIKKEAKHFNITDFRPQPLPEVYLSGTLKVDGIPEAMESTEEVEKQEISIRSADIPNIIKPERDSHPKRMVTLRQPLKKMRPGTAVDMRPFVAVKKDVSMSAVAAPQKISRTISIRRPGVLPPKQAEKQLPSAESMHRPVPAVKVVEMVNLKPRGIRFSPAAVVHTNPPEQRVSVFSSLALFFAVLGGAVACAVVVLITEREVVVWRGLYVDNFSLNSENIFAFVERLFK